MSAPHRSPGKALDRAVAAGLHVAIVLDGNGRWASARGLPRAAGHRAGVEAVRRVVRAAPELGIGTLTLYAFSASNWQRPAAEVDTLLRLLHEYLLAETDQCSAHGIRLSVIGRRDRLSPSLREAIEAAESATAAGELLHLRIAIDYSAREAIFRAACRFYKVTELSHESFARVLGEVNHDGAQDVDLLIRTGGEQRLSDFLLWESAYAELLFTPRMWPEFDAADLVAAVREFHTRERRFGRIPDAASR
ncbi:MAG TPA: di-trans,poly-cis-decaprenylcistransferase [Candidatus Acidoferrales bacterium]|jgi:undecaprenyl diphosphate synthase|nr:di-trans,poly-cis-decaprenylcistransferase [Candidatus Acidoferrales bacterium]